MHLRNSRLWLALRQFERQALAIAGLVSLLGVAIGGIWLDPVNTRAGAITLGVSVSVLASLIVGAIALGRDQFADYLISLGVDRVFNDRLQEIPVTYWNQRLSQVRDHFRVLGMANHGYITSTAEKGATREAVTRALGRDKMQQVEFLWLNPTTPIARKREQEEGRGLVRDICETIIWFWELAESLPEEQRALLSLREYHSLPTCGITWADNQIIVTHYLAGELNQRAPGMFLDTTQPILRRAFSALQSQPSEPPDLARSYIENYQEVASDDWSRPIDAARIPALKRLYEQEKGKTSEADLR